MPQQADVPNLARSGDELVFRISAGETLYSRSRARRFWLDPSSTPTDYGLLGMVATITVLGQAISDFGFVAGDGAA